MTTVPTLSPTEPFVDRYRRVTSKWYPWLKRMLDGLREAEQSVIQISQEVTAFSAAWSVSINVDEHVVGLVRLSSQDALSEFTVVADKFVVSNPGDGTDTKQVFTAGIVDGVPTVGINGSLLVDGTIFARSLNVGTLSAISADIGTVTAGVIQSSDGNMVIDLDNKRIRMVA